MFSLLPLGGAPTGCDISTNFSDSEAVAVYDKCASYTCQTARFGKAFGPMMRITFVLALLLSTFGPSRAIAQNTPTWSPIRPVRIVIPSCQRFHANHDARGDEEHPRGASLTVDNQPTGAGCLCKKGTRPTDVRLFRNRDDPASHGRDVQSRGEDRHCSRLLSRPGASTARSTWGPYLDDVPRRGRCR